MLDKNKFRKECTKFYRKHWKTKHFVFEKGTYLSNIVTMSRDLSNYEYSRDVFKHYNLQK